MRVALAALAAVSLLPGTSSGAEPLCQVRVLLEPEGAVVGQQIVYRLQILRQIEVESVRFARDLGFPSFRTEWLPGQSPDPAIANVGDHALIFEERRALFPVRAGELEIPAARLACVSAAQTVEVEVPAKLVRVSELPGAGQPPEFGGVVGPVAVQAHVSSERVVLGQSLALTVTVRGAANAWDAAAPFDPARDLPGVDVYARPPETEREAGRRLEVRRSFSYELVPRAAGAFSIPALRVPYFDAERARYEIAETPALRFTVEPAAPAAAATPAPVARAHPPSTQALARRGGARLGAVLLSAVALLAAIAWFAVAKTRGRRGAALRAAAPRLDEATAASARGDHAATARALAAAVRAALEVRVPGASALAAEEMAARDDASLRAVAETLVELDRARFAAAASRVRSLDVERVRALIASL
jgi:hypothetical protein